MSIGWTERLFRVFVEQLHVSSIGFEYEIECVPDERNGSNGYIQQTVEQHAHNDNFGEFELKGAYQKKQAEKAADNITSHRDHSQQGLEPKSPPCAGNAKRIIKQPRKLVQLLACFDNFDALLFGVHVG